MEETNQITEEIVIVGSRYGAFADVLEPYYEKGEPLEPKDIKRLLGSDEVYLQPVGNNDDPYAVGVFITMKKRLGFVWKDQSPSLREQMAANNKKYYKAHIKRINTRYGLMMAEATLPDRLSDNVCRVIDFDKDWAKNIPETVTSITEQSLSLGFAMLCDELPEMKQWNDTLENRFKNLKQDLPADLSGHHIMESRELYDKMKKSAIKEVRESCDDMLDAYVSRGSKQKMKLWANNWLPQFFREFADSGLLGLFEAANYTLERVETLLNQAPAGLFYLYKFDRERFAFRLYYSALPQEVYNRLLTLLAVREAMLEKEKGVKDHKGIDKRIHKTIEILRQEGVLKHLYDFTWIMETMNQTVGLPKFNTPRSFITYMETLGIKNLPSEDSINRKQNTFIGKFPDWTFNDCDTTEATRRINVGKRFLSFFRSL